MFEYQWLESRKVYAVKALVEQVVFVTAPESRGPATSLWHPNLGRSSLLKQAQKSKKNGTFRLNSLLGFQIIAHGCSSPAEIIIRLHSSPRFPSFGYYALEYKDPAALSIVRVLYGLSYAANKAEQTWIG